MPIKNRMHSEVLCVWNQFWFKSKIKLKNLIFYLHLMRERKWNNYEAYFNNRTDKENNVNYYQNRTKIVLFLKIYDEKNGYKINIFIV